MLTDRPDVPRTPFGRLKPTNVFFWGKRENAPTMYTTMFLGSFLVCSLIKITYFAIRGHFQPLEVNSRTFYDISALKCIFRADIICSFLGHDFLPYSESLRCGECYSVLQQHHLN